MVRVAVVLAGDVVRLQVLDMGAVLVVVVHMPIE
jgi:hypothetical protein